MSNQSFGTLIIILCIATSLRSQNLHTQAITVADGLTQGFIESLFEDSRGFIWIGTLHGLNRFDGYNIKQYTPDNSQKWALKSSFIHCLAEDKNGLIWIGTEKGPVVLDPYTERFLQLSDILPALPEASVHRIYTLENGSIWLSYGLQTVQKLYVLKPPASLKTMIRQPSVSGQAFRVDTFPALPGLEIPLQVLDKNSNLLVITIDNQANYFQINPNTLQARPINLDSLHFKYAGNLGYIEMPDAKSGRIFGLFSDTGLIHIRQRAWPFFLQLPGGEKLLSRSGDNTLYQLSDLPDGREIPYVGNSNFYEQFKPYVTLDKPCSYARIVDRSGNIWVGTTGYGVRKISPVFPQYERVMPEQSVYNFQHLPNDKIWPGLYNPQQVYNIKSGRLETAPWHRAIPDAVPFGMLVSRDSCWWMAARRGHQMCIFKKKKNSANWNTLPLTLKLINDLPVQFLEDRSGQIWYAGNGGQLLRFHPETYYADEWQLSDFFPEGPGAEMRSNCLIEVPGNCLWLGTNRGLLRIDNKSDKPVFTVFFNIDSSNEIFTNEYILSIHHDPKEPAILWLGTRGGGLNRFDTRTGRSTAFTKREGLPDNVVYGILADSLGRLWLSTNRGLCLFDPETQQMMPITGPGTELFTEFNTCAYKLMASGTMAFGSIEGLFFINPATLQKSGFDGTVAITQFSINGVALKLSKAVSQMQLLDDDIYSLDLPSGDNNLGVDFAALPVSNPSYVQYRYRFAGQNKSWISIGSQHSINLVAIPAGSYTLELQCKAATSDWETARTTRIHFRVRPPWYSSPIACIAYGILAIALLWLYLRFHRRRLQLRHQMEMRENELERLKQLEDLKKRFYSYIAHEFKTPLTIILGMAKRLSQRKPNQPYAGNILTQGQNMLELVDQMLDIGKINDGKITLQWQQGLISPYLEGLVESMRPLAEFNNINLQFETAVPELLMDFDPGRLKYVINNLLSNAIQYTPPWGSVRIHIEREDENHLLLVVADNGSGISQEDQPHIFERYFQGRAGKSGTDHAGLGLAFVKDLVDLFGGTIQVSSKPDEGTTFTISLPISQQAAQITADIQTGIREPDPGLKYAGEPDMPVENCPRLLVVEDNPYISEHLKLCLKDHFQLYFARNGKEVIEYISKQLPEIILTDVMMPEMDGLELTQRLKSDELTSHIPIVMLSAKSEIADRLAGHSFGANAYIGKPFDEQELLLILQNLYRLQQQWRERYVALASSQDPLAQLNAATEAKPLSEQPDTFILKLYTLFENIYTDEKYDLNQLCKDLNMSKSQLQRKLAAINKYSAMQLLRNFRLQKAKKLLKQYPMKSIREVCFLVGYKDPAHFSRQFTRAFNESPSDYRNS